MKKTFLALLFALTCYSCSIQKTTIGEDTILENENLEGVTENKTTSKTEELAVETRSVETQNDKPRKGSSIAATRNFNLSGSTASEL